MPMAARIKLLSISSSFAVFYGRSAGLQGHLRSDLALRSSQDFLACSAVHPWAASRSVAVKAFPPRPKLDEKDIEEKFLRGSGPGGQKINKTSSAVQLKHLPTGIVVKSQASRSREQNRSHARRLLAERLEEQTPGAASRSALKQEITHQKKASKAKKSRRKYRALAAEKEAVEGAEAEASDEQTQATKEDSAQVGSNGRVSDQHRPEDEVNTEKNDKGNHHDEVRRSHDHQRT